MSLKDFNYKQFFFDYGEKIGLATAGVVALILGIWLFIPGSGLLAESAQSRANQLLDKTKTVSTGLDQGKPTDPSDLPPPDRKERLVAFTFDIIPDATIEGKYRLDGLYNPAHVGPGGRQMPSVALPAEAEAALVHFQMPGLVWDKSGEFVMSLKGATTAFNGPGGNPNPGGSGGVPAMPNTPKMPGAGGSGGSGGGFNPAGQFNGKYGKKQRGKGLIIDRQDPDPDKAERDYEILWVKPESDKDQSSWAMQPIPVRAVEIVASFPFRDQIDEFKHKLGLNRDEDVLGEWMVVPETIDGKETILRSFRFLGVQLQRRTVDATGKPVNDADGAWTDVDLQDGLATNIVFSGGASKLEPETKYRKVALNGLTLPKLPTIGDRRTPPVDEYPDLEGNLKTLKQTVADLDKEPGKDVAKPPAIEKPGDIFNLPPAGGVGVGPGGSGPGGAVPPPMPMGGGSKPIGPPPGMSFPNSGNPNGGGTTAEGPTGVVPKYVLVRLFDFNIDAGKTYEYRMRVKMANPNYGRKDVVSQGIAVDKELNYKSPDQKPVDKDKDFYVIPAAPGGKEPLRVTVSPDLYFYALDQAKLDDKDPKIKEKEKDKDKDAPPKLPLQPVNPATQTVLQIQKWVDFLTVKRIDYPIGDWVIAERVVATRGQPIGRQRVEAPYWRKQQNRFTMLADQPPKSNDKKYVATVEAPFTQDGREPVLVDFTGGDLPPYMRTHPKADDGTGPSAEPPVTDKAPEEVLIYTADGKLLSRNATRDAADPDRIKRLEDVRAYIENVKQQKGGGKDSSLFPDRPGTPGTPKN